MVVCSNSRSHTNQPPTSLFLLVSTCACFLLLIEPPAEGAFLIFGLGMTAEVLQVLITAPARHPRAPRKQLHTEEPCSGKGKRAGTQLFQMLKILGGGAKDVLSFPLQWLLYRHPSPPCTKHQ